MTEAIELLGGHAGCLKRKRERETIGEGKKKKLKRERKGMPERMREGR